MFGLPDLYLSHVSMLNGGEGSLQQLQKGILGPRQCDQSQWPSGLMLSLQTPLGLKEAD